MNDREEKIRAGLVERTPTGIVLYWELYGLLDQGHYITRPAFTVDTEQGGRWRFRTLAEADEQVLWLQRDRAVQIAGIAFGLRKSKPWT